MHFSVSVPQFIADGTFDSAAFRAYLSRAEALGFDGAWTLEQVLGSAPILSPLETLAYAAACTQRLRLGCAVFVTPLHGPVDLAKSISTLDQLSHGRVEVGVGTGAEGRMFPAFGVDPTTLVSRFTEGLRLMKALWTQSEINFDGRFWQLSGAAMEPKPVQKPHPPIWFGGNHPAALRRAVKLGDGFIGGGSSTTIQYAEQVRILRAELAATNRDPAEFRLAKRVYIMVDGDPDRGRRRVADGLRMIYGPQLGPRLLPVAVSGPPDACVRGVREVIDAGAQMILFTPFQDQAEQMERLASEVVPRLR